VLEGVVCACVPFSCSLFLEKEKEGEGKRKGKRKSKGKASDLFSTFEKSFSD